MILAKIRVTGIYATLTEWQEIPKGIRGAQITMDYEDPMWDNLQKTVIFKGCVTRDVINAGELVTIPPECVERAGAPLKVGVFGTDAENNRAIPTLWADLGRVRDAADPSGDESSGDHLPVWAQIIEIIGDLDDLTTDAKSDLVKAINEAATKGGSSVSEEEVWAIVDRYLQEHPPVFAETDPTVPSWAKQPQKPSYSAQEVGADPAGTAAAAVSGHNTSADTHNDLRLELKTISNRLNAFFDSDDQTMDELSEIVAYITSNKSLIDAITTSKVSVSDIVNNLATNVGNRPLSAAQGVVLKGMLDALASSFSNYQPKGDYALRSELPTKTSQLTNDSGFITKAVSDLANYYLKSETYTKDEVKALVSAIPKFSISVVQALPTQNISATTIYLVPGGADSDLYTEYIRVNNGWEILGAQRVDLTGYATEEWVEGKIPTKLPNPSALTIDGKAYDGSSPVEVKLPTELPNPNGIHINGTYYDGSHPVSVNIEGGGSKADMGAYGGEPGWVKRREFYDVPDRTIVDNLTVTSAMYSWINHDIVADHETVTVVYDGQTYVCPISFKESITEYGDESYFYLGNFQDSAPEYPFCIWGYINNASASVNVGDGSHTITVTLHAKLKKIDPKFIPSEEDNVVWDIIPKAAYVLGSEYADHSFENVKLLTPGSKYIATIDGTEYEREAVYNEEWDITYIGNFQFLDPAAPEDENDDIFIFYGFDNGSYGLNMKTPDYANKTIVFGVREKKESGSSGGCVSSWNDLTDRPFYSETVMVDPTFDGDITGREAILVQEGTYAVKVSPQSVAVADMIGTTATVNMSGTEQTILLTAENAVDAANVLGVPGAVVLQGTDPIVLSIPTDTEIMGTMLSAGTWFMYTVGQFYVKTLSCLTAGEYEVIKKIDKKYLPDTVLPFIDLVALGLEDVPAGGMKTTTDGIEEVKNIMKNGPFKYRVTIYGGGDESGDITATAMPVLFDRGGLYTATSLLDYGEDTILVLTLTATNDEVRFSVKPM